MSRVIVVRGGSRRSVIKAGMRGVPGADGEGGGGSAGVSSFNTRVGPVMLLGTDVTAALGYSPANNASLASVAFSGSYADLSGKPSLSAVAISGDYADLSNTPYIPAAPGDIGAASAAQGAKADTAVQPSALAVQLDLKVDNISGYGLSQENYTPAEKAKLAGLEGSHYRGTYLSLTALQAAIPVGTPGDYADVDAGAGSPVLRYIWDDNDSEWVAQAGSADPVTAAQVKALYEANPDTNAYTDAEKSKLGGVAAGATANDNTDSLGEGSSNLYYTAARVRDAVLTGLSLASAAAVSATDNVLSAIGKLQRQINDLATALSDKQATLVSGTNIKTVNGQSVLGPGNLTASAAPAAVFNESTSARALGLADAGAYIRFTNAAASTVTVTAQSSVAWVADTEVHIRRAGAGNLTLAAGAGVTLNAPSGGTLIMTDRMSVTLKRVEPDKWDVIGQTVTA